MKHFSNKRALSTRENRLAHRGMSATPPGSPDFLSPIPEDAKKAGNLPKAPDAGAQKKAAKGRVDKAGKDAGAQAKKFAGFKAAGNLLGEVASGNFDKIKAFTTSTLDKVSAKAHEAGTNNPDKRKEFDQVSALARAGGDAISGRGKKKEAAPKAPDPDPKGLADAPEPPNPDPNNIAEAPEPPDPDPDNIGDLDENGDSLAAQPKANVRTPQKSVSKKKEVADKEKTAKGLGANVAAAETFGARAGLAGAKAGVEAAKEKGSQPQQKDKLVSTTKEGKEAKEEAKKGTEQTLEAAPTTERERINSEMKKATEVLKDEEASDEDKFDAAVRLIGLVLERIKRNINGTLDDRIERGEQFVNTETGKEAGKDAPEEGPKKAPAKNEVKEQRRQRLQKELADGPHEEVDSLIDEKQDSIKEKVAEIDEEMNSLEEEIDEFEKDIDKMKEQQDELGESIDDANQRLASLDAIGEDSPEIQAERKQLKETIRDAQRKIDDLSADIEAAKDKIKRREEERKELNKSKQDDPEIKKLREDIDELKQMKKEAEVLTATLNENFKLAVAEIGRQLGAEYPELKGLEAKIQVVLVEKTLQPQVEISRDAAQKLEDLAKKGNPEVDLVSKIDNGVLTDMDALTETLGALPKSTKRTEIV